MIFEIVGEVGSGKSSLLMGALGFLDVRSGSFKKSGDIAYVPQKAFLLNNTVRENILFGKEFDKDRYNRTLINCCLVDVSNFSFKYSFGNFALKFFRILTLSLTEIKQK